MAETDHELPPVYFNHLYVVLNDRTYRAIQASDFLRSAFPGWERRSTLTAAGETWSGTYYYCRDNYLEFFGETAGRHWKPGAGEGWAGLAFSTDQPGGVAAIKKRLEKVLGYTPFSELRQLSAGGKKVNWFYHVRLAERLGLESFDAWIMEYHPDIFAYKGIVLPPGGEPTRLAYLSPWNRNGAGAKGMDSRRFPPVFSRLTGATITMSEAHAAAFSRVLQALGYAPSAENGQVTLSANQFTLTIRFLAEDAVLPGYRLSSLRLEMARPSVAPMTFIFPPNSRLVLNEDQTAEWLFGE